MECQESLESMSTQKIDTTVKRYNIMIAAIQETRWQGFKIFDTGDNTVCYSGSNEHNLFGTGFMIHKRVKDHMLNFELVDKHICYLKLQGKFLNVTIICVHAPTENNDDIVKSSFYDRSDRIYDTIPKHDAVIIMGDMNTEVSKDPLTSCTGICSLCEIANDNGDRLCDFATSKDLIISNTMFPHKKYSSSNLDIPRWTDS